MTTPVLPLPLPLPTFEAHVTVRCAADEVGRFAATCAALGVKPLLIELPVGSTPPSP